MKDELDKDTRSRQRGFTLIELLVVIAIIGVLSSVVLASLNTARSKARDAARISDIRSIRTALEMYANDHNGQYPYLNQTGGGSGCWWNWQSGNVNSGYNWLAALQTGGYISQVPVEQTIAGCDFRYINLNGGPTLCGSPSGTYAVLYWITEEPRPINSPYSQPACWASMLWYEAGSTDPYGNMMIIPE